LVVHRFSVNYMNDDPGYRRFFLLLDLMTANLVVLVLSGNLILLAVSWSLTGVLLYLLLVHNTESENAKRFGTLTLVTHLMADVPLGISVYLLYRDTGSLLIQDAFSASPETAKVVTLLIVISAILKSAQFPFHLWIVYSMEGPTPVSALMHAGIVNAGAFLVNRFAPLFLHDLWGLQTAFLVGSVTAVLGSALMLIQNDVKRALGYSTVGQMGYMIMEIGVGAFALAVYHMIAHGIFKATLFLYSGNVIHSARRDPNIPEDDLYRAVVKSEEVPSKVPWVIYGAVTVIVPLVIVLVTHLVVDVNIVKYETALILLFFGWVTGVQALISTFRVGRENPFKTVLLVVLSMAVVMLGYAFIGHSLQVFLYPSEEFTDRIYRVAFGSAPFFVIDLVILGIIILAGWVFLYYTVREKHLPFHLTVYTYMSRELYIPDLYALVRNLFLRFADRIGKITLMSSPVPVYSFFLVEGKGMDPLLLLAVLFIPLFPSSVITALILRRSGFPGVILFLLAGSLLINLPDKPGSWVHTLAVLSMILHGIRVFRAGSLRDLSAEIYSGVMPAVWLSPDPVSVLVAGAGPLVVSMMDTAVVRRFGTGDLRFVRGLTSGSPGIGWALILSVLCGVSLPPLGAVHLRFALETDPGSFNYSLLMAGWFLISAGSIVRVSDAVFGKPREDTIYPDMGLRDLLIPFSLILVSSIGGILKAGGYAP
ncbi:MAG: proton-conducting transporter membrane subunit, partial [Aquificota bacterium]|nr:proton-conducting transporter membrane subunit [Aquificota bacterium]